MAKLVADAEEELLSAIARQILRHAPRDGETTTLVPGLTLYRANSTALIQRGILKPSVCVVAQGEKVVQAGADTTLRYGRGNFLASSIDMPVVGQVIEASKSKPYLVAFYELTPHDVLSVLADAKIQVDTTAPNTSATFVGTCDARLLDVVLRSLKSLDDEREARFLAPLLRKELSYRLVTGPSAFAVCQSAWLARSDDGIGRAVDWLKSHFKEPLSIPDLAKRSNMSPSTLQHKFKATVMMAPLQYQKRLRLEEARRLLLHGLADATTAAFDVGYESPSQFTREYRRHFGMPPLRDIKRMRSDARAGAVVERP
ncbi:MAG TPA: AraC family transcriptional regulator [Polyangiales bacterium]|nr:AraC family transcriptional regulator [Polyangiales bacterium]